MKPFDRRTLLTATAATLTAGRLLGDESTDRSDVVPRHGVFTKPLLSLSDADMAGTVRDLGLGGVEFLVRSGGRIEPAEAPERIAGLVATLRDAGVEPLIMASDINDPDDPLTERILRAAVEADVPRYRMRYFRYERGVDLKRQLDRWAGMMKDLAAMNRDLGIAGLYQNHADYRFMSGPIWDLDRVLDGVDPDDIGVAYDLRHATVEGGRTWQLDWELIRPRVRAFYVKDFRWTPEGDLRNVPLGEGFVDLGFYGRLDETERQYPTLIHVEYYDHTDPSNVPKFVEAYRRDYATLRRALAPTS